MIASCMDKLRLLLLLLSEKGIEANVQRLQCDRCLFPKELALVNRSNCLLEITCV